MKSIHFFRHLLTMLLIAVVCIDAHAQITYLGNEKFSSKTPSGWSIQPMFSNTARSWKTDTGIVVSAKYAMHGYVPLTAGDTSELITPFYDCSNYSHVILRFSHICKVLPSDICEVQYQEQGLGTYYQWKSLPRETYLGNCTAYKSELKFSHNSYLEWGGFDSLIQPNSGWYKQETFDISNYASFSTIRFRFIIRKGSYLGSYIAAGWYVDDFQVLASNSVIRPPVVEFIHAPNDTLYSTGPFKVTAKVATRTSSKIVNPYFSYTSIYGGVSRKDSVKMTAITGDSIWTAVIPQHRYNTDISYSIYGRDAAGNTTRNAGHCYLKHSGYGTTNRDSIIYGSSYASGNSATPLNTAGGGYNWSKVLFMAQTIDPKESGRSISGMAFYTPSTPDILPGYTRHDKIYLKATTLISLQGQGQGAIDPASEGAILVFDGDYVSTQGWTRISFDRTFYLNPGENLLFYRVDTGINTCQSTLQFYSYNPVNYIAQEYYYTTLNCSGTASAYTTLSYAPTTMFFFGQDNYYDSNSVAIVSIDQPAKGTAAGRQPVKITLQNKGENDLVSASVYWMVNGVLQNVRTYTGKLPCDFYDTLTLGTYTQKLNGFDTITVWVKQPNNRYDSFTKDDSLQLIAYGCDSLMHGAYTIGTDSRYDFTSIKTALKRMMECGISGDITFKLASGIYTENLDFTNFNGLNGYRLTIASLDENADSVVFRPKSGTVLKLNNTQNITLRNITLDADHAAHSYCVYLGSASKNVEFNHCTLLGWLESKSNSNTYSTIFKPSGGTVEDIRFIGNRILGGSYGVYLYGNSTTMKNSRILFDSNYISRSYSYPFYGYYNQLTFSHNFVEESSETDENYYGIEVSFLDNSLFDGNRIVTYGHATNQYGLRLSNADSTTLVCNNEIIMKGNNGMGACYGMYFTSPYGVKVINNSLLLSSSTPNYGISTNFGSVSYSIVLQNNLCITNGKSSNYPLFLSSNMYLNNVHIDYNCWWSSNGTISYAGGALISLPAHLNVFPTAIHDIFYYPAFADTAIGLNLENTVGLDCPRFQDVTHDYKGNMRIAFTTMGAYSEVPPQQNGALLALLDWPNISNAKDTLCPSVVLMNKGMKEITNATLRISVNQNIQGKDLIWKGKLPAGECDTIALNCFYPKGGKNTLKVWLTGLDNLKDSIPEDDTLSAVSYTCGGLLSGNFTVGKGGYFSNMTEAANALESCGMNGPVTLQLLPDTLMENVVLSNIPGISATNTLTLCSSTNDSSSVLWLRADDAFQNTTSENAAPLILDNISHVIIRDITLSGVAPKTSNTYAYSHGIVITGKSSDIEIQHCNLRVPADFTEAQVKTSHNAVFLSGSSVRDIRIHHNRVEGGANGFFICGETSADRISNIRIEHNTIVSVDFSAIYCKYVDSLDFTGNNAKQRKGNFVPANAQVIYADYTNANFTGNVFDFESVFYGLYASNFGSVQYCSFINNEMRGVLGENAGYGIYSGNNVMLDIYHNSFSFDAQSANACGLFIERKPKQLRVKNNIFYMRAAKSNTYPIFINDTASLNNIDINYNCYFNAYPQKPNIGYISGAKTSLQDWKMAVSTDQGSVSLLPHFSHIDHDLALTDSIGIGCPSIPGITEDLLNQKRDSLKTNMGAYLFNPKGLDLTVTALLSPTDWETTEKSIPVQIQITNIGKNTITSASISYAVNGVNGAVCQWTGKLDFLDTAIVTIGNIKINSGSNNLNVYCFRPNGNPDENPANDSLQAYIIGCDPVMSGIYNVGGNNAHYRDLNEALNALNYCGMDGPVILNVASGKYDPINMDGFNIGSRLQTLTIRSAAGNRDSVIFEHPYACRLNNISHVVFEDVSFNGSIVAVEMSGSLENVTFHRCNIFGPSGTTNTACRAVNYANAANSNEFLNDVRFISNNIRGGYYNMYLYYSSGNTANMRKSGLTIDSNTFSDAYAYGIYNYYYSHIQSCSHNTISNAPHADSYYAYYGYSYSNIDKIIGNRVFLNNNNAGYGFYFQTNQNAEAYSTQVATFANNEIILIGSGTKYGVHFLSYNGKWNVCNNSIYVKGTSTCFCLYNNNMTSGGVINVYNNVLIMGLATGYPFYIPTSGYVIPEYGKRDYNNYINLNGNNLAYLGSAKTDLNAIQQTNLLQDQHSISTLPVWKDASLKMLQITNTQAFPCPVIYDVKEDINGNPRMGSFSCMGCYGIEPDAIDASLLDFVGVEEAVAAANQPISVVLSNRGLNPLDTATISLYINGNLMTRKGYSTTQPLNYDQKDTVFLGYYNFHIGNYTFQAFVDKDKDSHPDNDTIFLTRQICGKAFTGRILIGNSAKADYRISQLDTLWNDMEACGVNGDITLAIESGNYTLGSTIDFSILPKIMNGYRLTLTSAAENRDSVLIISTAANMFNLSYNNGITIRNLGLENTSGNIIYFNAPCKNIDILYNRLNSSTTTSSSNINPILKPIKTGVAEDLRIIGNRINGGYDNIYVYGENTSSYNHRIVIDSNECINAYSHGIFIYDNDIISLSHNRISCRPGNSSPSYYGIYSFQNNFERMMANDIDITAATNMNNSYLLFLNFTNTNGTNEQALIANNIIKGNSTGIHGGVHTATGSIKFYHNSIYMGGTGSVCALYSNATAAYPTEFIGNQFITSKSGYPLYSASSIIGNAVFDYNNYYSGGTNIAYYGRNLTNINALRTYTNGDKHSVSVPVEYVDLSKDQKLTNYIGMTMPRLNDVNTDCENSSRDVMTAMGAYEPLIQKLDAALTDFGKTTVSVNGKSMAEVTLLNYGKDTLTSADIAWSINGVTQKNISWKGSLPMFSSTVIQLDSIMAVSGSMFYLNAWVSRPNNGFDMNTANDTLKMGVYACNGTMSGTYYVGGNNADFATLNDALDAIYTCGVGNPVVLKVRSGKYGSLEITGKVYGADKYNTITVMADNNASVIIDGGASKASITLSNTSFWNFRNITFGNTVNGLAGVLFLQMNKEIHFHGCNIYASTTALSTDYRCITCVNTEKSGYYLDNVSFVRNNIRGGFYNIYLYYMGSDNGCVPLCSITIDSNTLSDACYCGIYSYYYTHFKSISHNTISNRPKSGLFFGIYNNYNQIIDIMEGNRIRIDNTAEAYGIYLANLNYSGNSGKPGKCYNNEIIVNGNGGNKYGIYFYQAVQSWNFSHNSVLVSSASASVYGLYSNNSNQNYRTTILNNLFTTSGPGTNYPIYLSSYGNTVFVTMDYNNYFALNAGTPLKTIGYASTLINSLATWTANTGEDAHATNNRPSFVDSTQNLALMDYGPFICPKISTVTKDINGKTRTSITSMGAVGADIYEEVNLKVEEFVTPKPIDNVICYADYTPVSIAVSNNGLKEADFSISPLKVNVDVRGAINHHFDTIITTGSLKYMQQDTFSLGRIPTMASGTYRIKVSLSNTADKVTEDDTLSLSHDAFRVELPYDVDFSVQPAEFVNNTMNGDIQWNIVQGSGSNPALAPIFGSGRLEFAGSHAPGASANAIFNAVNIHNCLHPTLSFWYAHNAACTNNDMLVVLVTTDGGATYTEIKRILTIDTATAWKQYDIDLTAFNQFTCLSVVFRAMSFGGSDQSIDRIRIRSDKDASLELLPIDNIAQRTACDNKPVDIKAVLTNKTLMSMDLQRDTICLNVTGAINQSNKYVYNKKLGGLESDTLTLGQIDLSTNGNIYLEAFMQSYDDNTSNDTVHDSTLYIMQDMALNNIIGMDDQTFKVCGDKVPITAVAVNTGNISVDRVFFRINLNGNNVVTDTVYMPMKPGDTLVHVLSKPYTVPGVSKDQPYYFLEVRVDLDCDGNADNDSISIIGQVTILDSIDIQILDITATTPAKGKTKIAPTVRIANIGNLEAYSVMLHVDVIDSSNKVVGSISEMVNYLAINETKDVTFTMNYTVPNYTGTYTLKAYVEAYTGDAFRSNDTLRKAFANEVDDTRIHESEELNWSMGQNIPNPANNVTRIPFRLPQDAEVVFSVMGANGQLIYREQINANSGDNMVGFDVNGLANGIYYYSMEYYGQRIVRKMNIAK